MACLRQEIAAKLGPTAIAGELATSQQSINSGNKELSQTDQNGSEASNNEQAFEQDSFKQFLNPSKLIELVSAHKFQIFVFCVAFFVRKQKAFFSEGFAIIFSKNSD